MRRSWVRRRGERYVLVAREASVILIMRLTPAREDWPPVTSDIPRETGKTIGGDSNYMAIAGDHTVPAVEEMNSIGALLAERAFDFDQPLWEPRRSALKAEIGRFLRTSARAGMPLSFRSGCCGRRPWGQPWLSRKLTVRLGRLESTSASVHVTPSRATRRRWLQST